MKGLKKFAPSIKQYWNIYALILILLVGLILRITFFNGLHRHDDWLYLFFIRSFINSFTEEMFSNLWGMRLLILLPVVVVFKTVGVSYYTTFIPTILFSLGSILLAYLISFKLYKNKNIALLSAFLLAIFPIDVFVSTTIRGDVEPCFFVGLSIYFFLISGQYYEKNSPRKFKKLFFLLATGMAIYLAYLSKDTGLIMIVSYFFLFIIDSIRKRKIQWSYSAIVFSLVFFICLEGTFYKTIAGNFFQRYEKGNKIYTNWIERGDYKDDPSIDPEYTFCVIGNIPTDSCRDRFRIQGFTNSYYSLNGVVGLSGYFYYLAALSIILIVKYRDRKTIPILITFLFFIAYITFGTMSFKHYHFIHKETRYFNILSIFLVILCSRGLFLLPKASLSFKKYHIPLINIGIILLLLFCTSIYSLSINHDKYKDNLLFLDQVKEFMLENKESDYFTESVYATAIDLHSGYGFSDPIHGDNGFAGKPSFGENKDIFFVSYEELKKKNHFVIVRRENNIITIKSFLDPNVNFEDIIVKRFKKDENELYILEVSPEDLYDQTLYQAKETLGDVTGTKKVYLDQVEMISHHQDYSSLFFDKGIGQNKLQLLDRCYEKGLATHANSKTIFLLEKKFSTFRTTIGLDSAQTCQSGSIKFYIYKDEELVFKSPFMIDRSPPIDLNIDISDAKLLKLKVEDGNDGITCDHATWAEAYLVLK